MPWHLVGESADGVMCRGKASIDQEIVLDPNGYRAKANERQVTWKIKAYGQNMHTLLDNK